MWSAVSNAAHQGKLVRLVHAATYAQPLIAPNLRQLCVLGGWISDVERQLSGDCSVSVAPRPSIPAVCGSARSGDDATIGCVHVAG